MQTEPLTQKHKLWVNALGDLKDSLGNLSLKVLGRGVWVCVCVWGGGGGSTHSFSYIC